MSAIEISEVRIEGARSLVRSGGPETSEEAVVFVHGNPGSSEDWLDLLPRVADFARGIAPDMPGYGKADRPRDFDYTVEGYSRHLDGLLTALGVRRVHLVLHDFGGHWGLHWAAHHPRQVASFTLFAAGLLPGYRWHKFARVWRTPILGELFNLLATRSSFRRLLNADNPKPFPRDFVERMFEDLDAGHHRAVLKLYRATPDLSGLAEKLGTVIKPFHFPALVLWGEGDTYVPVRYAPLQKEYFDAEVRVMPGCGHWPMIDEPERCRDLVLPFLQKQWAQAPPA